MTSPDLTVPVRLPARNWSVIDATMDNVASNALDDLDEETESIASAIRQAGWDQVPWVDGEWPPMDQVITIALAGSQWQFAMSKLEVSVTRPDNDEDVELCGAALAVVRPQLPSDL